MHLRAGFWVVFIGRRVNALVIVGRRGSTLVLIGYQIIPPEHKFRVVFIKFKNTGD
ncbi:hypothetical protein AAFF_G00170620 [Aldrovandia affinis]|uniref:Uncharacterized protein n=1 Tax=Aldrovandia affinis TaxID=143900 RepID=A0AAD7RLJ0_9TELE|nr:hypothetical protein AAFF_G00170620 [Aldrovandia affinis]